MAAAKPQQKPTAAEKKNQQQQQQEQEPNNKNKFSHHNFLYKAAIVAIFFVILPLFPSQAPEFINQSALVTRNWELLHILFVGVAISYGLFSRKNKDDDDETGKENNNNNNGGSKFDNAQSLVSRFLQVSSFFDDEAETTPAELLSPSESDHETAPKVQTWSNQHHRNEPVVVVAPSQQAHHRSSFDNKVGEKPLLLPVRSLKSRLSNGDEDDNDDGRHVNQTRTKTSTLSLNRSIASKARSKSFSSNNNSSKARNIATEIEGSGGGGLIVKEKMKDNVVLPSPIPWRSRSGRLLEPNKQEVVETPTYASRPSIEESEFSNKVEARPAKLSQNNPRSSRTSPSPNKEISHSSPNSFSIESLAKNAEDVMRKKGFCKSCPPPPPPPPPMFHKSISMRPRYGVVSFNAEGGSFDKELKRSFTSEGTGKWVGEGGGVKKNGAMERSLFEDEESFMEEPTRKSNNMGDGTKGYENISFRSDKFMEEERNTSFLNKVVMESDDDDEEEDSEIEDEHIGGSIMMQKDSGATQPAGEVSGTDGASSSGNAGYEGPDVDKKADEFIAKFREQIRLQRIESIKRSTRSTRNSSSR